MSKERYTLIPEVFLILIKEGKVLLAKRANTGYEDGKYSLPGGHGEEGETMCEGALRESAEEIGSIIKKEDMRFVLSQHRICDDSSNPHARIGFYFSPTQWEGDPQNLEPEKCDDVRWFPLQALPQNMVEHTKEALLAVMHGKKYHEHGWK